MGDNLNKNTLEFCRECGSKNEENELFCGNCGNHLENPDKTVEEEDIAPPTNQTNVYPTQSRQTTVHPIQSKQTGIYPTPRGIAEEEYQSTSKYPVSWDEGISISLGATLFTWGLGVVIIMILFFAEFGFEISLLLFFGVLPMIIGYLFLRSYMVFTEMIKLAFGFAIIIMSFSLLISLMVLLFI